jgi:serine/threonine protein kinase
MESKSERNPRMLVFHRKNPIEVNYDMLEVIGKGGYGEVKKVKHKTLAILCDSALSSA